jgi:alpha-L-fucosidase
MKKLAIVAMFILFSSGIAFCQDKVNYLEESPESYNKRMQWFTDAKYGMFIHFGLYSQLGGYYKGSPVPKYAEWIQAHADIPSEEYAGLIKTWKPDKFDADKIVRLAKDAGMKYLVITTKHHEGFCLWDSKYTDFDIAGSPMKGRDFIKELSLACKKHNIVFGTYYSIIDWHHPSQTRNNSGTDGWGRWGQISMLPDKREEYVKYMKNQIRELIENYDTNILWFDGDWVDWWDMEAGKDLYQYARSLKPGIIINNRVAKRDEFKKDFGTPEQKNPANELDHNWEACYTMNGSWGYKKDDQKWKSAEVVYNKLKEINNLGGNLLLNIGPDGNGEVPPPSVNILIEVGKMLKK